MKKPFIAYNADNMDFKTFETEEQAEEWLQELFDGAGTDDGFSADMTSGEYFIAKVIKRSHYVETANKKDYTDEEWEEEGYSDYHDSIGHIEMKPVDNH